jgi:large subunit ribosomal protein L29
MNNIDFKNMTAEELNAELLNAELQSQDLRYNHSIAPLQNTQVIKIAKKLVARIKTELRSRELSSSNGLNRDKIIARRKKARK